MKKATILISFLLLMYSCEEPVTGDVTVESIQFTSEAVTLETGEFFQLRVSILPEEASGTELDYTSSKTNIATVSASGLITTVSEGDTQIVVTTKDGLHSDVLNITVSSQTVLPEPGTAVESIQFAVDSVSINTGESIQLGVTVLPAEASDSELVYSSSEPAIATVSSSGLVTALSEGAAQIVVITKDGLHSDVLNITVSSQTAGITIESIQFTAESANIITGESILLGVTVLPSEASKPELVYTSSEPAIATVSSSGLVTAVSEGTTNIVVSTQDGIHTDVLNITVEPETFPETIAFSDDLYLWNAVTGETIDKSVVFTPADTTNKNVIVTVDKPKLVSYEMGSNGVITFKALNTTGDNEVVTVTVASEVNPQVKLTMTVRITRNGEQPMLTRSGTTAINHFMMDINRIMDPVSFTDIENYQFLNLRTMEEIPFLITHTYNGVIYFNMGGYFEQHVGDPLQITIKNLKSTENHPLVSNSNGDYKFNSIILSGHYNFPSPYTVVDGNAVFPPIDVTFNTDVFERVEFIMSYREGPGYASDYTFLPGESFIMPLPIASGTHEFALITHFTIKDSYLAQYGLSEKSMYVSGHRQKIIIP